MTDLLDRLPAVAGRFYPSDPDELREDIAAFLAEAEEQADDDAGAETIAIVSPHAGYVYCGGVAGHSYREVAGKSFARVVVLSPSHTMSVSGVALHPAGSFRTPLGAVPIDEEGTAALLMRAPGFFHVDPEPHRLEHGIETQLPFLQQSIEGDFSLVPLIIGAHDLGFAENLARYLSETFDAKDTLYIASSDLSHYHPYDVANQIDGLLLELLEAMDLEKLARGLELGEIEACGAGAILTAALIAREQSGGACRFLHYENSGDRGGDRDEVVGYSSFVWSREGSG
ncbi:MAG: AmmeMemoRadiSam system protein B [Gemmatimonadetes bacterium]|nr:AmmeMemoRadiSam system protein B [Gemmatimonadota bacterium]